MNRRAVSGDPRAVQRRARAVCAVLAFSISAAALAQDPVGKIASVQNEVETRRAAEAEWKPSVLHDTLAGHDRIRTGSASRAAILYADQTLQRINEKSEVEILPPGADAPGVLRVISGTHYFSSRRPKDFGRIETPTVTAAIRGTEFVVAVGPDGATTITMLEGIVDASNALGSVTVTAGEEAVAEAGKAPVKRIVVRPRDAVAWSLYYPPVTGPADAARLEAMGAEGRDLARAAELLTAGQADQAGALIRKAREARPDDPLALALASVIEVVGDRGEEGLRLAERAAAAAPDSTAAALALSFASQAAFDIPRARGAAETAARLAPDNAEAQARVAELRMAQEEIAAAREAAENAVERDPRSPRALTVLGFVQLAELRSAAALETFRRAVEADPAFPLARVGLGIATIRRGDLAAGREEIQTAAALDPGHSLIRSYLAKAYYEEKREEEAAKEIAAAIDLDPSDPTPHLYDAIQKQTWNRPVEALDALRRSIALNDRRAVYRSRLLLDQDLAVRGADLATIFNDLGFEELGMVTARRSADADHSNASSHLFLAGNYRNLPGFAPAFLSEVLQARVYQPVNVNAVRPDVVNESASFNEYTSLIDQPRLRAYFGGSYGETDTDLGDYFAPGEICFDEDFNSDLCTNIVELDDSNLDAVDGTVTYNRDRFAAAVSYGHSDDDGFRINNDTDNNVARGFFAFAPTWRDQVQIHVIDGDRMNGDLPLREFPVLVTRERFETNLTNVGLSYRRVLTPADEIVFSFIHNDAEQTGEAFGVRSTGTLTGPQFEAQYVHRQGRMNLVAGAGYFDGEQEIESEGFGFSTTLREDDTFGNAYVYARFRNLGPWEFTAGASWEDVTAPVGLLPPRDSFALADEIAFEESRLSPKAGVTVYATPKTVVRAAVYHRLSPALGRLQTLEPTQVSGFNQFFDDPGGSRSWNYGLGVDQEFTGRFFGGFSIIRRDVTVPDPFCDMPTDDGCAGQAVTRIEERESDDWIGTAYLSAAVGPRVALNLEYAYEEREFDFVHRPTAFLFEDYVETQRLRPEVRVFFPFGLFASAAGTRYDQKVDHFFLFTSDARDTVNSEFWIGDVRIGYRFPNRWGSVVVDGMNLWNEKFDLFRSALEERVVPARTVILSVRVNIN